MGVIDWGFPFLAGFFWLAVVLAVVWEAAWKGIAMWRAAQNSHLAWFICILIFNTLGILPIVYIFAFSKKSE